MIREAGDMLYPAPTSKNGANMVSFAQKIFQNFLRYTSQFTVGVLSGRVPWMSLSDFTHEYIIFWGSELDFWVKIVIFGY